MKCSRCKQTAVVALPSHNSGFCRDCYLQFFTGQVEKGIRRQKLFTHEDRILVALSGGKDSLALMLELSRQGYTVTGLHIDLAIPGSSAAARAAVEGFCATHSFPLIVREMAAEGLAIPEVKKRIKRPICSMCGKIKRHYFNKTALEHGFTALATGHNLDDEVARLFSNTLRWDVSYLADQGPLLEERDLFITPSQTLAVTEQAASTGQNPEEMACEARAHSAEPEAGRGVSGGRFARKVKPLWRLSEFETANYAFLRGIENHYFPCPYSRGATFTYYKSLWADLEERMPGRKIAFYQGFLERGQGAFAAIETGETELVAPCTACGYPTSTGVCGVCRLKGYMLE